jgi:curved DNA-binding protein CbpA
MAAATMRCHYEVLQLEDRNCSIEDIKKQYKRLALVFHPDRNHV